MMKGEHFFGQTWATLRAAQLDFRRIAHTSRLRLYGEYRYSEDHGCHWKLGRVATAHQFGSEAPAVRVREIYTDPQAERRTQDLVVTQGDIESSRVIIKPLTLLQKRRFLERRRVTRVASLWLGDIYRIQINGRRQWNVGIVLCIYQDGDPWVIMKDLDGPAQTQFHFTQHDLETGRVVLCPRTIRERLKRRPIEQRPAVPWQAAPESIYAPMELPEQEDLE